MAGFWAAIHLLRLVSDLARQISRWVSHRKVRRHTLRALRVKSRRLLAKAMAARRKHSARQVRRASGSESERLRQDDGFRRD